VRRGGATFVWVMSWSEMETARANEQVVGGEAEVLMRGGDSSCEAETCRRSHSLVGDLSGKPPTSRRQRLASDGLDKDLQSSSH
jgi:hypothetical protein